jgi:hypothetical protein
MVMVVITQRKNKIVTKQSGYMDSRSVSSAARVRLSSRFRSLFFLKKPIVMFDLVAGKVLVWG